MYVCCGWELVTRWWGFWITDICIQFHHVNFLCGCTFDMRSLSERASERI
jgi:hypothetical protein